MTRHRTQISEQGFGLLEVLIAAGIFAIIAAAMTNNLVFSINAQRTTELRGEKEAFKKRVLEHYSCYGSGTGGPNSKCNVPSSYVNLKDTSDDILIPSSGKTIGKWTYVAECTSVTGAINIRAVHFQPGVNLQTPGIDLDDPNQYIKDPLTRKTITMHQPDSFLFRPDLNPADQQLCDGTRDQKLVPFYGSYAIGPFTQDFQVDVKGKPILVVVFSPGYNGNPAPPTFANLIPNLSPIDYCAKTLEMGNKQPSCGGYPNPGTYNLKLDPSGFFTIS